MFLMTLTTKNNFLKWILSIGIVVTLFSLYYFYGLMPTPDSQSFRALTEYFIKTKSLDPAQLNHVYYQWPAFFVLADIVTSVTGLTLTTYEFLLFTLIGLLLTTVLYVYGSKKYAYGGVLIVVAFFISITSFIDYQAVPFSLALALLFVLFMLETRQKSIGLSIAMLILYACLLMTHLFVPLFFVLYLLARSLFEKNGQNKSYYRSLFIITLVSYFLVEFAIAKFSLGQIITNITKTPLTYSQIALNTFASSVSNAINDTAQLFSRTVTIAFIGICIVGLVLLLVTRKTSVVDKAILFTGVVYSALGAVLNTLGYRAIAVAFLPISLGAAFLFKGKFRPYLAGLFIVLLVLFPFVPLHQSFNSEITFQTGETYTADNFFLNHYQWQNPGFVITDFWTQTYLASKLSTYVYISTSLTPGEKPDSILYSPQFAGLELGNYSSVQSLSQGEKLNILYNDGFSYVLVNGQH